MASAEIEQLQEAMELGAVRERNRIIALLDAEHSEYTYQHQENKGVYIDDCAACFAIAIIKGKIE